MSKPSWPLSALYFLGMLTVFVGERMIGAGTARFVSLFGVASIGAALAMRAARMNKASADRRVAEQLLLALYALGLLSVALYITQSDLSSTVLHKPPLDRDWPKLATSLAVLWPALWLFSALPIVMTEFSYNAVARAPKLEVNRVRDAALSGIGLAGAIVFAFALVYIGTERDKKLDLSYFRTARAGESTHKIIRTLDQPVEVSLFFPPANEVRSEIADYFEDLKKESKLLEVKSYDRDVDPQKAKELSVSGNGIIVFGRGNHREQLAIGLDLEAARTQLKNLDRDVQQRLLKVARPARIAYFVTGHGERSFDPLNDTDKRGTLRELRDLLSQQGYTVRTLGAAEGLAADVPNDATIVILAGPQKPLLTEEAAALVRYYQRGGRLLVALDPEEHQDEKELLAPLGLSFVPTILANDQIFYPRAHQPSDRANILTNMFSSHPSVTALGRYGGRAALLFVGAGHLEETKDKPKEVSIDLTVRSLPSTWDDQNGNFTFDTPPEQRKSWTLVAAATLKKKEAKGLPNAKDEGRALVLADSDMISDAWVGAGGNPLLVLDGMKWLSGEEAITGEVSNESDIPIVHTRKQDVVWFYGSVFLAPALVILFGFLVTRRRTAPRVRKETK
jgi:hypothetical protein